MSELHSVQPASPGATTSTVCGLNSVMPPELSAAMLLASQPVLPATFRTARLAPGAMPLILMLHPRGSGCAGLTKPDRS
jgi:hypothetical protein